MATFSVNSVQDLALLTHDELAAVLTPDEERRVRALLRARSIRRVRAKSLVGEWVDI